MNFECTPKTSKEYLCHNDIFKIPDYIPPKQTCYEYIRESRPVNLHNTWKSALAMKSMQEKLIIQLPGEFSAFISDNAPDESTINASEISALITKFGLNTNNQQILTDLVNNTNISSSTMGLILTQLSENRNSSYVPFYVLNEMDASGNVKSIQSLSLQYIKKHIGSKLSNQNFKTKFKDNKQNIQLPNSESLEILRFHIQK